MDLVSRTSDAVEHGHVFMFRFAGAGAEVTTSIKIDVADPLMAEAFAANLMAEISQRMEAKRMSYDALRAMSAETVDTDTLQTEHHPQAALA